MLPSSAASLVSLALLGGVPGDEVSMTTNCEDVRRIELASGPSEVAREVCVSPGLMTGLLFDAPVVVDLEDEIRFVEVMRGRTGVALVPPRDMAPGERLRLTVRYANGASTDLMPFVLVAHAARATRQVEVYRDTRTRESYLQEVAQERARSRLLQEELQRMRAERQALEGLGGAIFSGAISKTGVQARGFEPKDIESPGDILRVSNGVGYRSRENAALEMWVRNRSPEPWRVAEVSLVNARGEKVKDLKFWQAEALAAGASQRIVVEVARSEDAPTGRYSLSMREAGPRQLTFTVELP